MSLVVAVGSLGKEERSFIGRSFLFLLLFLFVNICGLLGIRCISSPDGTAGPRGEPAGFATLRVANANNGR